jgi:hypothetical protein
MKMFSPTRLLCSSKVILVAQLYASFFVSSISCNADAKRLYDDLMSSYNSLIRPVGNVTEKLTVKVGVKLSQLVDVVSVFDFFSLPYRSISCDILI